MYEFIKLLKRPIEDRRNQEEKFIAEKYWTQVVKQSEKKQNASSMFSLRMHAVYECTLWSNWIKMILVTHCIIIVKVWWYRARWRKILVAMLEKDKKPEIGKLKTITLIEADL